MSTLIPFVPSSISAPQFQATLDGLIYTLIVKWDFFGQRYDLECYDLSQNLVFRQALIGSPNPALFASLSNDAGLATGTSVLPHGVPVGNEVVMTVSGASPDAYNGVFVMVAQSPVKMTYRLTTDPVTTPDAVTPGQYGPVVNLAFGYFQESTLAFFDAPSQFLVTP